MSASVRRKALNQKVGAAGTETSRCAYAVSGSTFSDCSPAWKTVLSKTSPLVGSLLSFDDR